MVADTRRTGQSRAEAYNEIRRARLGHAIWKRWQISDRRRQLAKNAGQW